MVLLFTSKFLSLVSFICEYFHVLCQPMKVAALQSNYLPWKGYFKIINAVDLFIFYDCVQFTKQDWRNRNQLKTRDGLKWLTIPCGSNFNRLIHEVQVTNNYWLVCQTML